MSEKRKTAELTKVVKNWVVLAVDNEQDNLDVVEKVLSYEGAKVYTAMNGIEGLAMLEIVTPTFILLDLSMPQMDGWEMLEKLRANPVIKHLPVIALTAHAMDGDRDRALEVGFDGYVTKPFRIGTLLAAIQECLDGIIAASHGAQL
jgi:two-component system, cell cycle response regulator DivK